VAATDPLQDLLAAAAALARRKKDVRLVLEVEGRRVEVRVGPAAPGVAGPLSEMEACILEALGNRTMTGQQIAPAPPGRELGAPRNNIVDSPYTTSGLWSTAQGGGRVAWQ
jgi:hypothetical protein